MPPLTKYLEELDQQVADDLITALDGIEQEYLLYNQMGYNWMAYRTATQENMDLFFGESFDFNVPGKSLLKSWRHKK
jgi:hypothetical protein